MQKVLTSLLIALVGIFSHTNFTPAETLGSKINVIEETSLTERDLSQEWWLNSGGRLYKGQEYIYTIQGELSSQDHWRTLYNKTNPIDTDDGYHPQNIFRLVSNNKYQDPEFSYYFKINKNNLSQSPNRNQSNGVLLMANYIDGDNLYYAGLRVDGYAVIKRKSSGIYQTLALEKIFEGEYDRESNPNLLPLDEWIGIKVNLEKTGDETQIRFFVDLDSESVWDEVLSYRDNYIWPEDSASVGIRTDFMDVSFRDIKVK